MDITLFEPYSNVMRVGFSHCLQGAYLSLPSVLSWLTKLLSSTTGVCNSSLTPNLGSSTKPTTKVIGVSGFIGVA